MARRRSAVLFAVLGVLMAGAIAAAILVERGVRGAIPGDAPITSLAANESAFFAGSADGLFVSADGIDWGRHPQLRGGRVVVATIGGAVFAGAGGRIARIEPTRMETVAQIPFEPTGLAGIGDAIVASSGDGRFVLAGEDTRVLSTQDGLDEVVALAAHHATGGLLAGGPLSGLWRAGPVSAEPLVWQRLLGTPSTALLTEIQTPGRIRLGTPGGLLISDDGGLGWRFTQLRQSISGLTSSQAGYFAISGRLIYHSPDGDTGWNPLILSR